jgi:cbb3-type cytochrome c oxidase subunit III
MPDMIHHRGNSNLHRSAQILIVPEGTLIMAKSTLKWLTLISLIIGFSAPGWSQEANAGKTAYLSSCAPCHGADAKGNGFLGAVLKVPPADLTTLTKRNGGVFPLAAVNEIIDGRTLIAAHGTRDMPIWGFDVMVRSRITLIVDYLNYIQEK